jgi:hypothetical protein
MLVTDYELQFTWASYKHPEKVEFVLAKNATMSDIVHTVQGDLGFTYSLPGNVRDTLESDKTYYWKVGAIDQEGIASFGDLNTFTLSQPGTSIDLIQFEEDVAIDSLPEKAYIGKTYQVQAVSTKAADRYRWTLGAELLQDGASDTLMLKSSDLGPGNYLLTVKAYFGNRHVSATRNFSVDSIKAMDAWANAYATIIRRNDGTLVGFGNRYWLGGTIQAGSTRVESPDFDFTDYQGYQDCFFWLRSDGTLWAAGVNYIGELGIGTSGSWEWSLKKVTSDVVQFSIGGRDMAGIFGLVLKRDGKVYAWGENGNGQLGTGSTARKNSPTLVPLEKKAVQVSAGIYHSYALLEDGTVAGWGNNGMGALGPRPSNQSDTFLSPRIIPRLTSVKSVFAGFYNGFFLLDSGRLVAMGHNRYGNLGIGQDWGNYETPQPISIPESVVRFASYEDTTFALTESGVLYVWGQNYEGMSGLGQEYGSVNSPRYLAEGVKKFSIGRRHSWYIDEDGAFWIWGSNSNWQLGDATSSAYRPMVIGW